MPKPLHRHEFTVRIRIKREVNTLFDLREVSTAVCDLDDVIASLFPTGPISDVTAIRVPSGYEQRDMSSRNDETPFNPANAQLISISMSSPLDFVISVNPGWIAIFLVVFFNYEKIPANTELIRNDLRAAGSKLKGLTEDRMSRIQVSAMFFIDWLLSQSENQLEQLLRRIRSIRSALIPFEAEASDWIEVEVIEESE